MPTDITPPPPGPVTVPTDVGGGDVQRVRGGDGQGNPSSHKSEGFEHKSDQAMDNFEHKSIGGFEHKSIVTDGGNNQG